MQIYKMQNGIVSSLLKSDLFDEEEELNDWDHEEESTTRLKNLLSHFNVKNPQQNKSRSTIKLKYHKKTIIDRMPIISQKLELAQEKDRKKSLFRFREEELLKKNEVIWNKNIIGSLSTNYLIQRKQKIHLEAQNKKYIKLSKLKEPSDKNKHYSNPFRKHYENKSQIRCTSITRKNSQTKKRTGSQLEVRLKKSLDQTNRKLLVRR